MKKVLCMIIGLMFLFAVSAFADNAATVKVGVDSKKVKLGDSKTGKVKLTIVLLDKNGLPATAGPNGEALTSLNPSVEGKILQSGGISCSPFTGPYTTCDLDYSNLANLKKYAAGTTSDLLTVSVAGLKATGKIGIEPPATTGISLNLFGVATPVSNPDILTDVTKFKDNDEGYSYRIVGDKVKFYVYSKNGNYFTNTGNGTVTIETNKKETASCTFSNGVCSGELTITKSDNASLTLTAKYTLADGTVVTDTSTTAPFKVGAPAAILVKDSSGIAKNTIGFTGTASDTLDLCIVDKYGNIVKDTKYANTKFSVTPANADVIIDNTTKLTNGCITFKAKDNDTSFNLGIYNFTVNFNGADLGLNDNLTAKVTVYADNNSASNAPKVCSSTISPTTINAGGKVSLSIISKGSSCTAATTSAPNETIYRLENYDIYLDNGTDKTKVNIVNSDVNENTWNLTIEIDDASLGSTGYLSFENKISPKFDFNDSTKITVKPDITSPVLKIKDVVKKQIAKTTYVADGSLQNPIYVSNDNVTINDQYGNSLKGVTAITSVTSKKGSVITQNNQYYVIYPVGTTGSDTITVSAGTASDTLTIDTIYPAASKFVIKVSKPDYTVFAANYVKAPLTVKICADEYLSKSKNFILKVDNSSLKVMSNGSNIISAYTLKSSTQTLSAGYQSCKTYTITADDAGSFTLTVHDTSTASPWDNATYTFTFAAQDKEAPSIDKPSVVAGGITFKVTDNYEVKSVEVNVYDEDGNSVDATVTPTYNGKEANVKVLGLEKGVYTFEIIAKDDEGNSAQKSYVRTISEAAPSCSADNLDYCTTQTDCEDAGGVWDNETCSAPAPSNEATPELEASTNITAPTKTVSVVASDNVTIKPTLTIAEGDSPEEYYVVLTADHKNWFVWTGGLNFALFDGTNLNPVDSGSYTVEGNKVTFNLYQGSLEGAGGSSFEVWYGYKTKNGLKYNAFTLKIE